MYIRRRSWYPITPRDYEQFSDPVPLEQAPVEEITAVEGRLSGNVATRHVRGLSITTFEVSCEGGACI